MLNNYHLFFKIIKKWNEFHRQLELWLAYGRTRSFISSSSVKIEIKFMTSAESDQCFVNN